MFLLFGLCFYVLFPINISAGPLSNCVNPDPACMGDITCEYDSPKCLPPAFYDGPDRKVFWGGQGPNCTRCILTTACVVECTTGILWAADALVCPSLTTGR